jgi:hypothetical protein
LTSTSAGCEAAAILPAFERELTGLELPPGLRESPLGALVAALRRLGRRLDEGPGAPLRLALFGPTGGGKSKLFNSLIGRDLSPSGFRRPYTMQPVYLLHEGLHELRARLDGAIVAHGDAAWGDLILVDTPDFDSVERGNRSEAERIFHEADAFVFVTDTQKYADQATWHYLDAILSGPRPVILVLNKVRSQAAAEDFFSRVGARRDAHAAQGARILEKAVVKEYALDDAALLPADDPGLEAVRRAARALAASPGERAALLEISFRDAFDRALRLWGELSAVLAAYEAGLAELGARLDARYQRGALALERDFEATVDPGLKKEVYSRVLQRLERIDPLRYPRRLLALPIQGLRSLYRRWRPEPPEEPAAGDDEPERVEGFRMLEGLLLRLSEETRRELSAERRCPGLLAEADFFALPLSRADLEARYRERMAVYREWLAREAHEAAASVTTQHKLKFVLSQVIYNAVVVGAQIHTAGAFTLTELLTDSILSPLVAKAVGMALSSERVVWFEKQAHAEYHRLLAEIIDEARLRFARHLEAAGRWRPAYARAAKSLEALERERVRLVESFRARRPVAGRSLGSGGSP